MMELVKFFFLTVMPETSVPLNLYEVLQLRRQALEQTYPAEIAMTKFRMEQTALLRYTLPGLGFAAPQGKRMTPTELQQGLETLKQLGLEQLKAVRIAQAQVFENSQIPQAIQRTYSSTLNQLISWEEHQPWGVKVLPLPSAQKISQEKKRDYRAVNPRARNEEGNPTQDYIYGLGKVAEDEISSQLAQELEAFKQFRRLQGIRPSTVEQDLKRIKWVLGYKHRQQGIPSEQLNLYNLLTDESANELNKATSRQLSPSLLDCLDWLIANPQMNNQTGRNVSSIHTINGVIQSLLTLAKYLEGESEKTRVKKRGNSPLINSLMNLKDHYQSISWDKTNQEKQNEKSLNWLKVLALTEQLRQQYETGLTQYKQNPTPHLAQKIAQRCQRFIVAGMYSYVFPSRPNLYQSLGISNNQDNATYTGYLSHENNHWSLIILASYFQGQKNSRDRQLSIPNIEYIDGKKFYDYLEKWLAPEGLRQIFVPRHSYLFTKENGKNYEHQTEFNRLLQNQTVRLTKTKINYSLIRESLISYLNQEAESLKIRLWSYQPEGWKPEQLNKAVIIIVNKFIYKNKIISYLLMLYLIASLKKELYLIIKLILKEYPLIHLNSEDFHKIINSK